MRDFAVQPRWPESRRRLASRGGRRPDLLSRIEGRTLGRLLFAGDALALTLALLVAYALTPGTPWRAGLEPGGGAVLAVTLPAWLAGVHLAGLYAGEGRGVLGHERVNLGYLVLLGTGSCLLLALALRA